MNRRSGYLVLHTVAFLATAAVAFAADPQAVKPRELPATAEETPRWAEAQRALEEASAAIEKVQLARPAPPEAPKRVPRKLTRDEQIELAVIEQQMDSLGANPYGKSQPPRENHAKLHELSRRHQQLRYGNEDAYRAAEAANHAAALKWDAEHRAAQAALQQADDEARGLKQDLELIHRARRNWEPHTVPVTAAELAAAPEKFVSQRVRLYDVTLVRRYDVDGTPLDGRFLDHTGVISPVPAEDWEKGRWRRAAFLDATGGPLPETFEQMIPASARRLQPGGTADVYGRVMRLPGEGEGAGRVVFLCEGVVPHCHWSGPPAPGFEQAAADLRAADEQRSGGPAK